MSLRRENSNDALYGSTQQVQYLAVLHASAKTFKAQEA